MIHALLLLALAPAAPAPPPGTVPRYAGVLVSADLDRYRDGYGFVLVRNGDGLCEYLMTHPDSKFTLDGKPLSPRGLRDVFALPGVREVWVREKPVERFDLKTREEK